MRILRRTAIAVGLVLIALMVVLARLAGADPTVELSRELRDSGYTDASVVVLRGAGDAGDVVIRYDPEGQPAEAVNTLSRRAAETAWTTGRIETGSISVRPRGGQPLDVSAADLPALGTPPEQRQTYRRITSRARIVIALASVAVLLSFALVVLATMAAVSIARRRTRARRI
ncbi:MAG: hypothetical protein ABIM89_15760 [Mycobacteriales bacterium]